jgi:hypothetical protein
MVTRRYAAPDDGDAWQLEDEHVALADSATLDRFDDAAREPFEPATKVTFRWDHWGTLRGRLSYVFSYSVPKARSSWRPGPDMVRAVAYSGLVYIDVETRSIVRITRKVENLRVPVREASTVLDYEPGERARVLFPLPFRSVEQVRAGDRSTRIDILVLRGHRLLAGAQAVPAGCRA